MNTNFWVKILRFEFEKENFISLFLFLGIIIFECQENYVLKLFQHMLER